MKTGGLLRITLFVGTSIVTSCGSNTAVQHPANLGGLRRVMNQQEDRARADEEESLVLFRDLLGSEGALLSMSMSLSSVPGGSGTPSPTAPVTPTNREPSKLPAILPTVTFPTASPSPKSVTASPTLLRPVPTSSPTPPTGSFASSQPTASPPTLTRLPVEPKMMPSEKRCSLPVKEERCRVYGGSRSSQYPAGGLRCGQQQERPRTAKVQLPVG